MNNLLTLAIDGKWAILPKQLEAISEIIQDHSKIFERSMFHKADESIQSVIGTMGELIEGSRMSRRVGSVGILAIDGPIVPRGLNGMSGPVRSLESYSREVQLLEDNSDINNIVLTFDSPGGYVTGVSEFADLIRGLETKTTGFVYGYSASASYWISSAVDELYASKTAEVGSIGTVALFEDRTQQAEANGIKRFEIVSNLSPNKRLGVDTPEGKKDVIKVLDQITTEFVSDVALGRKTTFENVMDKFGQGKMFIASEAKELGMIDGITTLQNLVTDLNNNKNININKEVPTMSGENKEAKISTCTVDEFKASNPSCYEAIFSAGKVDGVTSEQTRLKSIEGLKADYPEASKMIDELKFNSEMDEGKVAVTLIKNKAKIVSEAHNTLVQEGEELSDDVEDVATSDEDEKETEKETEASIVSDMVAGAEEENNKY